MKLCVLMPVYNEERFVVTAIRSILAARNTLDIHIIIVDDGSTDTTVQVIETLFQTVPDIRLILQPNQGVAKARNTLLDKIPDDCDLVTFLDGDDMFSMGWLEKQCQRFVVDPKLDAVYGQLCTIETDKQDLSLVPKANSLIARSISMSCGIYRPALLKETGYFDLEFTQAEDMDFLLRLFESDPKKHLSDDIAVLYRQHAGNMTKDLLATQRDFARASLKHIMRVKKNPKLASLKGIFNFTQKQEAHLKQERS